MALEEATMIQQRLFSRPELCSAILLIVVWLAILLLRLVPIGGYWDAVDRDTLALIILWVGSTAIFVVVGGWLGRRMDRQILRQEPVTLANDARAANIGVILLSIAAAIGASLIIYEFAFIRGYGFTTPVSFFRIAEVNRYVAGSTSSIISGAGRLALPAIMPAIVLAVYFWRQLSRWTILTFWLCCGVVLFEQTMFEGGRLFIGATYMVTAISLYSGMFRDDEIPTRQKIRSMVTILGVYFIVMAGYFGWVFVSRFQGAGEDMTDAYSRFSNTIMVGGDAPVLPDMPSTGLAANPAIKFFWLYATHGIDQLGKVLHFDFAIHTKGFFTFPQVAQISDKLLGTQLAVNYFGQLPSAGLYTTLIGSVFVDFGYFGSLIFAAVFGLLLGYTVQQGFLRPEASFSKMAFPLVCAVAAFSPMVSIVNHMWPSLVWAILASMLIRLERRTMSDSSLANAP